MPNLIIRSDDIGSSDWRTTGSVTKNSTEEAVFVGTKPQLWQIYLNADPDRRYTITFEAMSSPSSGSSHLRSTTNNNVAWSTGWSDKHTLTTSWQRFTSSGMIISSSELKIIFGGITDDNVDDVDVDGVLSIRNIHVEPGNSGKYIRTTTDPVLTDHKISRKNRAGKRSQF